MFLSPGGEKFAQLMCALASHVLGKIPLRNPPLEPSPVSSTNSFVTFLKLQVLKGHLHSEFEAKTKMTNSFQEQYLQYKMLARYPIFNIYLELLNVQLHFFLYRELQSEYRELCSEEVAAKKDLCLTVSKSSMAKSKKQAFLDLENEEICLGIFHILKLQ